MVTCCIGMLRALPRTHRSCLEPRLSSVPPPPVCYSILSRSLYTHLSFQLAHASPHLAAAIQATHASFFDLRAASVKVPVRVYFAHGHLAPFFVFSHKTVFVHFTAGRAMSAKIAEELAYERKLRPRANRRTGLSQGVQEPWPWCLDGMPHFALHSWCKSGLLSHDCRVLMRRGRSKTLRAITRLPSSTSLE
jgi:hypothetical protein